MRGILLLLALLFALSAHLSAQERPRLSPLAGVSIGTTRLPEPLVETCGGDRGIYPALAAHAGVARGSWTAALHGSVFVSYAGCDRLLIPASAPIGNGVHRFHQYSAARGTGDAALSLQLRYAPPSSYWTAGVGAGRLVEAQVPYALAAVSLHTRGRVRAHAGLEHWTLRLRYEDVEMEVDELRIVRRTSLGRGQEWPSALALRLGVEVR